MTNLGDSQRVRFLESKVFAGPSMEMEGLSSAMLENLESGDQDSPVCLTKVPPTPTNSFVATSIGLGSASLGVTSSMRSSASDGSGASSKFSSKDLRANLTRWQKNRNPMNYYTTVAILGVGSMGSVQKVRKLDGAVGGSARKHVQERVKTEKQMKACFEIPLLGGLFKNCVKLGREDDVLSTYGSQDTQDSYETVTSTMTANAEIVYAMKSIHLSRVTDQTFLEELQNEIQVLKSLDHPHIVKAIETFEYRKEISIVMELCSGGDLYSRDPYTEEQAARITGAILDAVAYMHSKGILHRDLKYENILFTNDGPQAEVKLIDFGLSKAFTTEAMTEGVGTIYTMAPEVLKGSYTKQADLWSLGVITYMLLSSQMPFYGRTRRHIVEHVMAGNFVFKGKRWKRISSQAKTFVSDLLVKDPEDRATSEEAIKSSWLNRRRHSATFRSPKAEEVETARTSMMRFASYSKLKKMALMVVAHKSSTSEIGMLRKIFQQYDTERNGILDFDEFKAAISAAGGCYKEEVYHQFFDAVDLDGSGKIRYTEFLAATIETQGEISEERLAEAFDRLDSDDSGFITSENLSEMLGDDFPQEEIAAIINEADIVKDGRISYAEFLALWEDKKEKAELISKEITVIDRATSQGSVLSDDSSDYHQPLSRSSFIDGKMMSERKVSMLMTEKLALFSDGTEETEATETTDCSGVDV